jgi:hypothetical protein
MPDENRMEVKLRNGEVVTVTRSRGALISDETPPRVWSMDDPCWVAPTTPHAWDIMGWRLLWLRFDSDKGQVVGSS